jgi:hypothetical protein
MMGSLALSKALHSSDWSLRETTQVGGRDGVVEKLPEELARRSSGDDLA